MAEETQDDSQKTEEPTQRRLEQAREKGQIARSQEVTHWFVLLAVTLVIGVFGDTLGQGVVRGLYRFVSAPHLFRIGGEDLRVALLETLTQIGLVLLLPLGVVMAAVLLAGFLQTGFMMSAESLKPKLEKISPVKGAKRLFSLRSLVEFAKGVGKIVIVATVIALLLWPDWTLIPKAASLSVTQFMELIQTLAVRVVGGVVAVMTVIAALDYLFQKQQHLKQLRMSKQELKEEYKQTEGDPMIKARLRQIRMERARRRMMAAVPEADVVITNPTHFAIALKYDSESMQAPRVTAKGADQIAFKMREIAEANDVPIVENPPLTRALYDSVELDQEIPPEHYRAVAEVIGYVMRLKGRLPARRTTRGA